MTAPASKSLRLRFPGKIVAKFPLLGGEKARHNRASNSLNKSTVARKYSTMDSARKDELVALLAVDSPRDRRQMEAHHGRYTIVPRGSTFRPKPHVPFDDANNKFRNTHDDSRYRFVTFKLFFSPIILITIETRRSDASRKNVNVFSFLEQIPS